MSHDGSSCKSYIKHPTEKERLDNLAFTSFPEDYLPYTSSYQHGREGSKAPPYLVWDERRPRRSRKRRKGCCNTAALISAIALIVTAILAVVAISVYLGVVTNLFRSPVLSLSGKFRVSEGDEFSETLLNSSSYQFLVKAETYQAMVENVFLSSSLEPAFIAARIYAFRPSLLVFFRVYLDRRKLQLDDASVIDLVKDLVKSDSPAFGALSIDKKSVDVDENEEWLAMPGVDHRLAKVLNSTSRPDIISTTESKSSTTPVPVTYQTTKPSNKPTSSTNKPTKPTSINVPSSNNPVPVREVSSTGTGQVISIGPLTPEEDTLRFSYGQWKPVPIEDSVSPSFGDQRTPPGRGSVRLLDEVVPPRTGIPQKPPNLSRPSSTLSRPSPSLSRPPLPVSKPSPAISKPSSVLRTSGSPPLSIGVGSVSVLEDPMSHLDPVPIRNLRPQLPVIPEGHQRGEVASSIMSSVSLVVRKPNKNNPTDLPETGRLEMAKPLEIKIDSSRKEHATYRFLEDVDDNVSGEKTTVDADLLDISTVESGESSGFVNEDFDDSDVNKDSESNLKENVELSKTLSASFVEYMKDDEKETTDETVMTIKKDTMFTTPEKLNILNETNNGFEQISNETTSLDHDITDLNTQSTTLGISFEGINESTSMLPEIQAKEEKLQLLPIYSMRSDIGLLGLNQTVGSSKNSLETIAPLHVQLNTTSENPIETDSQFTSVPTQTGTQQSEELSTVLASVEVVNDSNESSESENDSKEINSTNLMSLDNTTVNNFNIPDILSTKDYTQSTVNNSMDYEFFDHFTTTEVNNNSEIALESLAEIFGLNFNALENSSTNLKFDVHTMQGHGFHQPISFPNHTSLNYSEESSTSFMDDVAFPKTSKASESSTISVLTSESYFEVSQSSNKTYSILFNHNTLNNNETLDSLNTMKSLITTPSMLSNTDSSEDESPILVTSSQNNLMETSFQVTENSQKSNIPESNSNDGVKINSNTAADILNPADITPSAEQILPNVSIVSQGGVPKIVPQFQDLGFNPNEIDSNDEIAIGPDDDLLGNEKLDYESTSLYNDVSNEDRIEIIRHITTIPPTPYAISLGKHPVFISSHCSEEEMQCASGECVDTDSRCNMKRDCRDNSDEKNCTCSDFLKVMGQSQKICDGVPDCKDLSDESNCPWCDKEQVICPQTKLCVNRSQICDGENDCPMGTDEKYCVKLAESVTEAHDIHYRPEGYLMVRKEGHWGKLCLDSIEDTEALQMKMDELGNAVCSALTYRGVTKSIRAEDSENEKENYFVISNKMTSNSRRSSAIFEPSSCQSKTVMRVSCNSLDCGLRPMGLAVRRRIVGGQSASSGSWPWQVALYKEGDFQCGAVLVSDTWLISAGHCFYSTQNAYWTARLGLLRRGSELPSPSEQIRRIEKIILHPDYFDKGFINDIALLKMDKPVMFSDYLRPVCLPLESEDAGLWHGKQCSVVGWGKLYEIGHTFPDSLQEVRLPVISTEECRKKIIFLTMYHITDNMFCAGFDRGGRDACLGDSGGPLMCQRDDGRWLLLGVTSNGDGCGRPNRPGVYTKVAKYLSWINQTMSTQHITPTFTDTCDGVRCKLGRCIPSYKICDTRWDCSEGADEDNCSD